MPEIDGGATAWVLGSSALVMFMTVGLALFYGGLVRSKNVLSTYMHSFFCLGLIATVWMVAGYALAFGPSTITGWLGGGDFYFLRGVNGVSDGLPDAAFMVFQMMFAIITPALISGAFAERTKFRGVAVFFVLWSLLVYSPVAHWVWGGGGWLLERGVLDFAGGTVVHINAGIAALIFCVYVGKRRGWPREVAPPHNVPMVVLGAGILWFGWFGFNAGSALAANEVAANAFATTHFGAAGAVLGWALIERLRNGKVTAVGVATGAVAGLVAITPAAGFVEPWSALVIGLISGVVCYLACSLKFRFGYDDSLDVVGVHFVGGIVGALLTGVFATAALTGGSGGAIAGNWSQVADQGLGVIATIAYSAILSLALIWIVDKLVGIRVDDEDEASGLDLALHGESAYHSGDAATRFGHGGASSSTGAPERTTVG